MKKVKCEKCGRTDDTISPCASCYTTQFVGETEEDVEDIGHYENGYRVFRDGSYREDFGSDR
jgi:hypothetical protein